MATQAVNCNNAFISCKLHLSLEIKKGVHTQHLGLFLGLHITILVRFLHRPVSAMT
jgi:hypothetical protein